MLILQFEENTNHDSSSRARGVAYFLGGERVCTPCKVGFFEQGGEVGRMGFGSGTLSSSFS